MRAVERVTSIIECFAQDKASMPLHEIAERVDLSMATTLRIVGALVEQGYLIRQPDQEYCLSLKFVTLAGHVKSTMGLREIAYESLIELSRQTNETVGLVTVDGFDRLCIDAIQSGERLSSILRPGERVPLGIGASPKMLLAYMPEDEMSRVIDHLVATRGIDPDVLRTQLARIRDDGFAISRGEVTPGLDAISVPIFNADGQVHHGLNLTSPSLRFESRLDELIQLMLKAGSDVSRRMSASGMRARPGSDARR